MGVDERLIWDGPPTTRTGGRTWERARDQEANDYYRGEGEAPLPGSEGSMQTTLQTTKWAGWAGMVGRRMGVLKEGKRE